MKKEIKAYAVVDKSGRIFEEKGILFIFTHKEIANRSHDVMPDSEIKVLPVIIKVDNPSRK